VFYIHSITTPIKPCTKDHSRSNGAQRTLDKLKNTFCLVSLYLILKNALISLLSLAVRQSRSSSVFVVGSAPLLPIGMAWSALQIIWPGRLACSHLSDMAWSAKPVLIPHSSPVAHLWLRSAKPVGIPHSSPLFRRRSSTVACRLCYTFQIHINHLFTFQTHKPPI
jgi:hypothetical protein